MAPERTFTRRDLLRLLAAGPAILLIPCRSEPSSGGAAGPPPGYDWDRHYWAYAIDIRKCIGCCACMRACRAENDVPTGYFRTWVERYAVDPSGEVRIDVAAKDDHVFQPPAEEGQPARTFFVPKLCNHCQKSVCNQVCPVGASYTTRDGLVLVDKKHCMGCGYCVQACPYGSRYIHPQEHVADKCTFCYHRLVRGLAPACVQSCPTGARMFGDLEDPKSALATLLRQRPYHLLRPEMGTHPKAYYFNLDPEII